MPHQCTACGRTFEDGSKEMLSGCPDCGGNKFQFKPAGAADGTDDGGASAPTASKKTPDSASRRPDPASDPSAGPQSPGSDALETEGDDRTSAVDRAASTVRDWVSQRDDTEPPGRSGPDDAEAPTDGNLETPGGDLETPGGTAAPAGEDSAQASARSDVVNESELPDDASRNGTPADSAGETRDGTRAEAETEAASASDDANPGLKELREELNSQFESIRIVEPGQYELNLMELYEREEYIVSLQEDGKYVIEVPDAWDTT